MKKIKAWAVVDEKGRILNDGMAMLKAKKMVLAVYPYEVDTAPFDFCVPCIISFSSPTRSTKRNKK